MKKGTKLYSILKLKCPRCQNGDLFYNPGLFVCTRVLEMPERCPHCNQDFKIEPGYYSAALWISYPIVLILFIPFIFLGISLNEMYTISFRILFPIFIIICLLLQIPIMRLSRAILINMTVDFRGN
ncbi:hypothetical protein D3C84_303600 [compost metagenome]